MSTYYGDEDVDRVDAVTLADHDRRTSLATLVIDWEHHRSGLERCLLGAPAAAGALVEPFIARSETAFSPRPPRCCSATLTTP